MITKDLLLVGFNILGWWSFSRRKRKMEATAQVEETPVLGDDESMHENV